MFKVLPLLFLNNSPGILKRRSHHKLAVCIHFNILKKMSLQQFTMLHVFYFHHQISIEKTLQYF